MALFIGHNAEAFLPSWIARGERLLKFRELCWAAFFAPIAWFLYRKMYAWAALAVLAPAVSQMLFRSALVQTAMALVISIAGLGGRRLYLRHADALIREITSEASADEARSMIQRAGGTSPAGAWIGAVIMLAIFASGVTIKISFGVK
jgi:hypothetical protein